MFNKRRKTKAKVITAGTLPRKPIKPRIFQPFRAIGYVTNDVPFTLQARGTAFFLTTCVGNSFHIYDVRGPQTELPITAIASYNDSTFVACSKEIIVFSRAKELRRLTSKNQGNIFSLMVLSHFLIAMSDDNKIILWNYDSGEFYTELEFDERFTVSAIVHPHTYLDKILIGSIQGTMEIWNIRTNKLVYSFSSFSSPITTLVQSPVVDVIAVGLLDGTIILHNIKADERIVTYTQEDDQHVMATANINGDIALWNLDRKNLSHVMKGTHDGLIPAIQFLNGRPILITSGADNSVKEWIFDNLDGLPRLLKFKSGHHSPPTTIQYYGSDGHYILSAAADRSLRAFSIVRDSQSVELSQGSVDKKSKKLGVKIDELKLPQITQFSAVQAKQHEWDNILSCHLNMPYAWTWSYRHKVIGKFKFTPRDGSHVKAAVISGCGNFGFIGSSSGCIEMFNMQSGQHRKTFAGPDRHDRSITGLTSDPLNRYIVSSSLDGTVKIWDFTSTEVINTIYISSPITILKCQTESNLLAIASDDFTIRVIDVDTRKIVRAFSGHRNRITDLTFSHDGRWIISSSLDSTIRTWDLPSGHMVDIFRVDSVATSVSFSPTGDFLATSHVGDVGIFLWANRAQFSSLSLRSVSDDDIFDVSLPTTSGFDNDVEDDIANQTNGDGKDLPFFSSEQLTEQMITLSTLPKSKWQNLLNLEIIKKRNKPKEPPKIPEKAPFFLTTLPGVEPKFVVEEQNKERNKIAKNDNKLVKLSEIRMETEFIKLLEKGKDSGEYSEFFNFIKTLNPSSIDFELRSMNLDNNFQDLQLFLDAIESRLQSRKDFELCQAYLNHSLRIYGDIIVANPDPLGIRLQSILDEHQKEWSRIEELLQYNLCMLDFLRK
ncbi:7967_t:CDS:10 [Ambispora gerdemannii]|uniref:7967_t:CDS:1 n=1 Tax=Ambispora gerdemannii TaxID=144530 RepID=A0A9N8V952_9GLOM|nr:7967_t:CDS:10 [Ambispora gerdemannii]